MSLYKTYAPEKFSELILKPSVGRQLAAMRMSGSIQNMIFYGPPGSGKSLAAKLLVQSPILISFDGLESPRRLLERVSGASSCANLVDPAIGNVLILDELDRLGKGDQEFLRGIIDRSALGTAFVATTNHIDRIISPLKSRMMAIDFSIDSGSVSLKEEWAARLTEVYRSEWSEDPSREAIGSVMRHFPDVRRMLAEIAVRPPLHLR